MLANGIRFSFFTSNPTEERVAIASSSFYCHPFFVVDDHSYELGIFCPIIKLNVHFSLMVHLRLYYLHIINDSLSIRNI